SQGRHLVLQHRYRPDSACEWLSGEPLETWDIVENGLRFRLDLGRNQNTGLFLDMRLGRRWVQEQAAGNGRHREAAGVGEQVEHAAAIAGGA
ncbi:class I SAM-dependent methyltransferase, partial [Pseudomonas aeruginosa]